MLRSDDNAAAVLSYLDGSVQGRTSTKEIERHYPHIVELIVPLKGFGTTLNDMYKWHSTRGIQTQKGSGRYHEGRHYVRWCFGGPEDAKAFQAEFGGELITIPSHHR